MDPSVYARAHGVQSEANNVTVTRVACGEIMYRRAVDTYRRDMKSKLNSLRKEQKRLRGCMRGYRRKLRESGQCDKDEQVLSSHRSLKKTKMPTMVHVNNESSSIGASRTPTYAVVKNGRLGAENARIRPIAASAPMAEKQSLLCESESKAFSARSCDPSISQPETIDQSTVDGPAIESTGNQNKRENSDYRAGLVENVGRTVRKGSGKIGVSSRQVRVSVADSELEDDAFGDVSDSSDDEEKEHEKSVPTDVVSFRNGMFVREITPLTLMKTNAAYFKPISKEIGTEGKTTHGNTDIVGGDVGEEDIATDKSNSLHLYTNIPAPKEESLIENPQLSLKSVPLQSMVGALRQSKEKVNIDKEKTKCPPRHKKNKEKVGVSFNDIIKIQISNNTKKLFSLVDRLAKTNGIPVTPVERPPKDRLIRNDPRELAATVRRSQTAAAGPVSSVATTHDSVYYAIKYGYTSDSEYSRNTPEIPRPCSNDGQQRGPAFTSGVPTVSVSSDPSFHTGNPLSNMPIVSLNHSDKTRIFRSPFSLTESEEGCQLSHKTFDNDIGSELASFLSEQTDRQRDMRRSSILEASKFMTAARHRRSFITNHSVSPAISERNKREKELFIRPRKDSVKPEHVEIPDNYNEPWASAFSRIKMIHTLADLTHII
ncbi:hypothetical protein ElyMa_005927200 [Elysia marginata]|uniref:Uncharacterized protein n=1 Tax=Elysia marginata TaxID=1093978 RepID=A0AAV4G7P7_9GAST|nr:hypothetical protein ElyMa_005927200 [Elysia marginata]